MTDADVRRLMTHQAGVLSRRQTLATGLDDNDIERLIRRREWAAVHPGVYVCHTGPLTWIQRAWAAVLCCWPSALCGESALHPGSVRAAGVLADTPAPSGLIHVAVEHPRKVKGAPGVRVHRVVGLADKVRWNLGPPRMRVEESVLMICGQAGSASEALAIAADACQQRRTTAERLLVVLERRRIRHGAWLRRALQDVASGAHSLLEHGYLHRVERAHGLPRARRQRTARQAGTTAYRDAAYEAEGVVVELDGRIGHEWTDERWADMDRDLHAGAAGQLTIRLGWRHVFESGCRTAERMAGVLQQRGWSGTVQRCGRGCGIRDAAGSIPGT